MVRATIKPTKPPVQFHIHNISFQFPHAIATGMHQGRRALGWVFWLALTYFLPFLFFLFLSHFAAAFWIFGIEMERIM